MIMFYTSSKNSSTANHTSLKILHFSLIGSGPTAPAQKPNALAGTLVASTSFTRSLSIRAIAAAIRSQQRRIAGRSAFCNRLYDHGHGHDHGLLHGVAPPWAAFHHRRGGWHTPERCSPAPPQRHAAPAIRLHGKRRPSLDEA
jgi:hypothetical protein